MDKIDPEKAIKFFGETQDWSPEEVRQQVLTPLENSSLPGTPNADPNSIKSYQIPGSITKDGQPIVGGWTSTPRTSLSLRKFIPNSLPDCLWGQPQRRPPLVPQPFAWAPRCSIFREAS